MEYLTGVVLALLVFGFGRLSQFDRDRAFYSTILIIVGTYYILFAAVGNSNGAIIKESVVALAFATFAVAGFKGNLWIVAAGLVGHGVFDFFHHLIIQNPGLPPWWPGFCMMYDVVAGALLAFILLRR